MTIFEAKFNEILYANGQKKDALIVLILQTPPPNVHIVVLVPRSGAVEFFCDIACHSSQIDAEYPSIFVFSTIIRNFAASLSYIEL